MKENDWNMYMSLLFIRMIERKNVFVRTVRVFFVSQTFFDQISTFPLTIYTFPKKNHCYIAQNIKTLSTRK